MVPVEECHLSLWYPTCVTDNGKQFDCDPFQNWCAEHHIRNYFSSPSRPQANGQVEATNKMIFKTLKKKLGDKKGN